MRQAVVAAGAVVFVAVVAAWAGPTARAQEGGEPVPPSQPGAEELACSGDDDCVATCDFTAFECCPSYCAPCTFALNREAYRRRQAECAAAPTDCPTVGACPGDPTERGVPRCLEGLCGVEVVSVEVIAPAGP